MSKRSCSEVANATARRCPLYCAIKMLLQHDELLSRSMDIWGLFKASFLNSRSRHVATERYCVLHLKLHVNYVINEVNAGSFFRIN